MNSVKGDRWWRLLFVAIPVVSILALAVSWYFQLLHTYFIMDDFLCASYAGRIFGGERPHVDFPQVKAAWGFYPYALAHLVGGGTELVLLLSRHIALVYALASLLLVYMIARRLAGGPLAGVWAVFWALTCTTFVEHSFSIRADMLATAIALGAFYALLVVPPRWGPLAAGLLLGVGLGVTQKSAYFALALAPAVPFVARNPGWRGLVVRLAVFAASIAGVLVLYLLVMGRGGHHGTVLDQVLFSPALRSIAVLENEPGTGQFYWQTFSRNAVFYTLGLAWLVKALASWRTTDPRWRGLAVATATVAVFLIWHRAPWPYTFLMIIPFLAVFCGAVSQELLEHLRRSTDRAALAIPALVLVCAALIGAGQRHAARREATSTLQLEVVRVAEALLSEDDTYFDAVMMVSARRHATSGHLQRLEMAQLLAGWDEAGPRLLGELRASRCKVVILNYRTLSLPREFRAFLMEHYVQVTGNVWVSGVRASAPGGRFDTIWPGEYTPRFVGQPGSASVDGEPILPSRPVFLSAGEHRLSLEGPGELELVPADGRRRLDAAPYYISDEHVELFEDPYTR